MAVATELGSTTDSRNPWIVAAAAGDKAAFTQLYEEFAPKVYNLVLRSVRNPHVAEDVCQEVWVRAYQKLDELREPAAFSTWLFRIASRACIDRARKPSSTMEAELPEQVAADGNETPEATAIRHERERLLWQSLASLPARQHLALFLREVEGKNYQEIAVILGTTQSAIETLLFRARRGVADAFERMQDSRERCGQAKKTMAALIDGEATQVQRRAIEMHADECRNCRGELVRQRQVSAAYGALPLFPLPALFAQHVLQSLGTAGIATSASGGASLLARLLGLGAKVKLATAALTITGGVTIATLAVPSDTPRSIVEAQANANIAANASAGSNAGSSAQAPTSAGSSATASDAAARQAAIASAIAALQQLSLGLQLALPSLRASAGASANVDVAAPLQPAIDALQHLSQDLAAGSPLPGVVPPSIGQPVSPPVDVPPVAPPVVEPGVTPPAAVVPTVPANLPLPTVSLPPPAPPHVPPLP